MSQKNLRQLLSRVTGITFALSCSQLCYAALPDQETYDFVRTKYSLLLEETRSGCGYYANPATLTINGDERTLLVLLTRGQTGGSMCNGVFEFQVLSVRCATGETSYSERIASPANYEERWYQNTDVAGQVCAIP